MENTINKDSNVLVCKFDGIDEININTFLSTMNNINYCLDIIAKKINPKSKFVLQIKAINKGSFIAQLITQLFVEPSFFDAIIVAGSISNILLLFLQIKQHLLGQKPISIIRVNNVVNITNINNQILSEPEEVADIYLKNSNIDNSLSNIADVIYKDKNRSNLLLETEDKKFLLKEEDLPYMSKRVVEEITINKSISVFDVALQLKKPDLLGDSKWQFLFNKVIEVDILDEDFKNLIHKRKIKNLYAGVKIPVKLQIEQETDENGFIISDTEKYSVLKVTGDIIEPQELNSFFGFEE